MSTEKKLLSQRGIKWYSMKHEEILFKTEKGTSVKLAWQKKEYRAYVLRSWGKWEPLGYGAALSKRLIEYLKENV